MEDDSLATLILILVSLSILIHRVLAEPFFDPIFEFLVVHLPALLAIINYIKKHMRQINLNGENT